MKFDINQLLFVLGMAFFGAIVHATAKLKIANDTNEDFNYKDFIILAFLALFAGIIFGLISTLFFTDIVVVIVFTALGSFLGITGLNKIANIFLEILIKKIDNSDRS